MASFDNRPNVGSVQTIRIGSRNSQLALIQTQLVVEQLNKFYACNSTRLEQLGFEHEIKYEVVSMTTTGDRILDKALPDIGAKSLFTKELEAALLEKRVDFVVHSLKDLPTTLPDGCVIGAIIKRSDPNDALVIKKSLRDTLKPLDMLFTEKGYKASYKVGTSSQRRVAALRRLNSKLECINIRGNLNTRLSKLDNDDGEYDAIVLANAGLERMEWGGRVSISLSPKTDPRLNEWHYAVGQGAMAVECRQGDKEILRLLEPLADARTTLEVVAERSLMRKLEAGCSVPLSVRSSWPEGLSKLTLEAIVTSIDGKEAIKVVDFVIFSNDDQIVDKNCIALKSTKLTTGIMPTIHAIEERLIVSSHLGLKVADKMIELGCLKLIKGKG